MIKVTVYQKENGQCDRFTMSGHALFADSGQDIVCAAVSALAINCINSIEKLTGAACAYNYDETTDTLAFELLDTDNEKAALLLSSFLQGVSDIESNEEYRPYIDVIYEEV